MALTLPANFKKDIQGRDTNLFPVVVIGNFPETTWNIGKNDDWLNGSHIISTNNFSFSYVDDVLYTFNSIPTLLNIPSLKESIDIEKRNYKISSVNIDISNFPHNGKRFSELVAGSSLINLDVRVYWWSQSADWIVPLDLSGNLYSNAAFQVFSGSIRRYTHDDEKVRLVVEDRSQATLHKDLPLPNEYDNSGNIVEPQRWLTEDDVPDKYKNKPIPMVYGHVDRSPCVMKRSPLSTEWGLDYGDIDIYPDFVVPESIIDQYVYFGDKYLPIPAILSDPNYSNLFELSEESINIIDTSVTAFIRLNSINSNPISRNLIPTKESRSFDDMVVLPLREKTTDLNSYISADSTNYTSVYRSETKEVMGSFVRDHYGGGDLAYWDKTSRLQEIEGTSSDIFWDLVVNDGSKDVALPACLLETGVANGSFEETIGVIDFDIDTYYGNVLASSGNHNIRLSIQGGSKILYNSIAENFSDTGAGWHETNLDGTGVFVIKSGEGGSVDRLRVAFWGYISSGGVICAGKLKFNTFNLNRYGLIEDVNNQDFYANVNGRAMNPSSEPPIPGLVYDPSAPQVITDILATELGQSVDSPTSAYTLWKYAFTVDKKINSKKLIENIASASPYIPRFDNMGNFKFDVIQKEYASASSIDHTIREADVISFTFKRTPIEDVCTYIEFDYEWDYARDAFNKKTTLDIQDWACADINGNHETFPYYGLPNNHSESTLIIDDDRGKYIRDKDTAERFVCWMMSWYCNQHLIINVKLPLKYMFIEIGNIVDFDELLGDVAPYGINYKTGATVGMPTFQSILKYFMVIATNKKLDSVDIEVIQMHRLHDHVVE